MAKGQGKRKKEVVKKLKLTISTEEGYTIPELLQDYLLKDPSIELAGYRIRHPLTPVPILYVRSKEDPKEAVTKAIKSIEKDLLAFKKAFHEAVKAYKKSKRRV